MCSQFENLIPIQLLAKYTNSIFDDQVAKLVWNSHIYPYTLAPVITKYSQHNSVRLMNYSLVPSWSKVKKPAFSSYNARLDRPGKNEGIELIYNASAWKTPFKQQRCLVPLTGFFESCRQGSHAGNIVKFTPGAPDELLLAAGIWDRWVDPESGEIMFSFAILTDDPVPFILEVGHDRQPVFLSQANAKTWLNTEALPAAQAYDFLKCNQKPVNYNVIDFKPLKPVKVQSKYDLFA